MKRLILFFFILALALVVQAQQVFTVDSLQEGDLLFVCDTKGNAITKVTKGINGAAVDHVGIAVQKDGQWQVLEAIHKGVVLTPLENLSVKTTHSPITIRLSCTDE